MTAPDFYHAHRIIKSRCKGRLKCIRNCPTRALRVRKQNVIFHSDLCIDCGNCLIDCPENVFVPVSDNLGDFKSYRFHIALASNLLYTQFDPQTSPAVVHRALLNIGFDEVASVSKVCDDMGYALRHHLKTHPEIRPMISSFCPSIVRFIQVAYPNLLKHICPLDVPREIVAREVKAHYSKTLGLARGEIGVIYITPCPAKIVSVKQPAEKAKSWIDAAVPIRDVYNLISPEIIKLQQTEPESEPGTNEDKDVYYGKAWGIMGHFSQGVGDERSISVAGIHHVKRIFDEIENDRLHNTDFVEAMACMYGCTNGVFCVRDPFVAKHNSIQLNKKYSHGTLDKKQVMENYRKGYYNYEKPILPRTTRASQVDIGESIKRMRMKERIFARLPQNDCGLCGAPTCETFAEDCAGSESDITDCIFFKQEIR